MLIQSGKRFILLCILFLLMTMLGACKMEEPLNSEEIPFSDSIASILYSTDTANEKWGAGVSYQFFVQKNGSISTVQERGLELNSFIPYQDKLLIHQKDELIEIEANNDITRTELVSCDASSGYGQASGILDSLGYHYSLFNIGFNDDMSGYISKIRWGDEKQNFCGEISSLIEASGHDDSSIYIFSGDSNDPTKMNFHTVTLSQGEIAESTPVELKNMQSEGRIMFTRFVPFEDRLVGIFADVSQGDARLQLLEIDPDNPEGAKIHPLVNYSGDSADYFFYNKNSIHVYNGQIYYVDGYGDVYSYDLKDETLEKEFHFEGYTRTPMLQDEQVFFKNDRLFFFRINRDQGEHQIESYSLSGDRISILPVKGIEQEIGRDRVHIYDFKILKESALE